MAEVKVDGVMYKLPEDFTVVNMGETTYYVSPEGNRYELIKSGFQAMNDCPFLEYKHHTGYTNRVPIESVEPIEKPKVKIGLAWELSHKLLKMLMDGGKLVSDHEAKLEIIDAEFEKYGDADLKKYVLPQIKEVISEYKRTGIWNLPLLGK
ncbi:hypothetical protein [Paenibacillus sp. IHBB 3054]|uniref:hypothetical protein n=1 Tax=Paenibacillus sp. IHBB 3054 TaxID=3425689 RepID=UPI003F675080